MLLILLYTINVLQKKKKRRKKLRTTSEFLEMLKNPPAQVKNMTS